ncbi:penicillin-binding transpeptidase domain-containing protein [Trichloromonas sp.]|uniref:penicillin-binding transpeptidase domain-containing protein n=1 Tax=Trichloromonas sp. TaxID=3069249 RepID=UPI002A404898|nr:penicillin-binding transpeptidase domain-containing protein [Trichloromonas sp.]
MLLALFGLFGFMRGDGEAPAPVVAATASNPVDAMAQTPAEEVVPAAQAAAEPALSLAADPSSASVVAPLPEVDGPLNREQVRHLLNGRMFANLTEKNLLLPVADGVLQVETSLDPDLQNFLLAGLDRKNSRHLGIVVMEPVSGRVLALVGFDRTNAACNPCLQSEFPAASLFKIVTAATAVDLLGYSADSPMHFNGGKHTLYKGQLTERVDRNTTTVPFAEAFADSINPVFGKLGELRLGRPLLERGAATFGFNRPLDFDVSLPPSHFQVNDDPYHWAEIASGFNRQTTLSPLHGAALVAAILNDGRMPPQTVVERIADEEGDFLYQAGPVPGRQIMSPRAAGELKRMMEATVATGTARKAFRGHEKDAVLGNLRLGGKTGSISNTARDVRYDWFVGYAKERQGGRQLVVSVMVGHEDFIGTRAGEYARRAISHYFSAPAVVTGSLPGSFAPQTSAPAPAL